MSKASEWKRMDDHMKIDFDEQRRGKEDDFLPPIGPRFALVVPGGNAVVLINLVVLSTEEALTLARWLLDTFDEPTP